MEHPLLYPFNFCSAVFVLLFLFHYFCSAIFVPQFFVPQFLFRNFCSADFLHLHLGSLSPNGQESPPEFYLIDVTLQSPNIKLTKSVEHPLLYPSNFCSAVFVLLFLFCYFCSAVFVLLFLFRYFCSAIFVPQFFVPLFLFHYFCSADLFALALGVPVTQWPRVPTNFCSTIFVLQFLFH